MLGVSPSDSRRRKRRIFLLLSAIVIPSAVVILLVFRIVRQENELSQRRSAEAQREALDQLRRELSARLQAIRLEEVNRLIGESGRRLPPDSPIVFVAPMMQDRMVFALGRQSISAGASGGICANPDRRRIARVPAQRCYCRGSHLQTRAGNRTDSVGKVRFTFATGPCLSQGRNGC
jgi:hypothetical protein